MTSFERAYKKLNDEQKQAVNHIDGPLMVIAGPGSGKTQLLSMRVANILKQTDASPSSIVCLTFTNKAADNMKRRLNELIGKESSLIYVRTFHSFASEIMNRHPEFFWSGARLALAPDAVQLEVTKQVLNSLPADHILSLKFAGNYTLIKDVKEAIKLAKEAGLTPEALISILESNIDYIKTIEPILSQIGDIRVHKTKVGKIRDLVESLPEQDTQNIPHPFKSLEAAIKESFVRAEAETNDRNTKAISAWKSRWLQKVDGKHQMANEKARNDWWLGIGRAYKIYREQLSRRKFYDYADMIVEVIAKIKTNAQLKAELQEQFQYVLIDEFQDTNAAQLQLAYLIADHHVNEGNPNLMVVGDDDQSIFKFQGAELSNMVEFSTKYKTAKIIVLNKNYRSTQKLLDCSAKIIAYANYRLINQIPGLSKNMIANTNQGSSTLTHLRFRIQLR